MTLVRARATTAVAPRRQRAVVFAIARVEGRRLLRNPALWLSGAAGVAWLVMHTWDTAPVLHRDDVWTGASMYPVAAVVLLLTNLATLRRKRSGTQDLESTFVSGEAVVTAGVLASISWVVAAAAVIVSLELAFLRIVGGIWAPSAREVLIGPAMVGIGGAIGVVLARWLPSRLSAPVALVALSALEMWLNSSARSEARPWFALWTWAAVGDTAREATFRPAGWHIAYLAGIGLVAGVVALVRSGVTGRRLVTSLVAVAVAIAGGIGQASSPFVGLDTKFMDQALPPEACTEIGGIHYCAHSAYAGWVPRWANAIEGVRDQLPRSLTVGVERVEQRLANFYGRGPDEQIIAVGAEWGRGATGDAYEFVLALRYAMRAANVPEFVRFKRRVTREEVRSARQARAAGYDVIAVETLRPGQLVVDYIHCKAALQSRLVVSLWLAARATLGAERALRRIADEQPYGLQLVHSEGGATGIRWSGGLVYYWDRPFRDFWLAKSDIHRAIQMLDGGERVARAVLRNWADLTDRQTSTTDLAAMLGLDPLPDLAEQLRAAGVGSKVPRELARYFRPDGTERIGEDGPQRWCP